MAVPLRMNHNKRGGMLARLKILVNSHSQVHQHHTTLLLWLIQFLKHTVTSHISSKPTLSSVNFFMQSFHSPAPKRPKQDQSSTENDLDYSICRGKITASAFFILLSSSPLMEEFYSASACVFMLSEFDFLIEPLMLSGRMHINTFVTDSECNWYTS